VYKKTVSTEQNRGFYKVKQWVLQDKTMGFAKQNNGSSERQQL
jgi:hypothetical protein